MILAQAIFVLVLLLIVFAPLWPVFARVPVAWRAPGWGQMGLLAACFCVWCVQWPVYYVYVLVCMSGHCHEESVLPGVALVGCNAFPAALLLWLKYRERRA